MSGRLHRLARRMHRAGDAAEWFVTRFLVGVLLVLLVGGLVWYAALEFLTPNPWSGPNAVADRFGWQVWVAVTLATAGILGIVFLGDIVAVLVLPFWAVGGLLRGVAALVPHTDASRHTAGGPVTVRPLAAERWRAVTGHWRVVAERRLVAWGLADADHRPATWRIVAVVAAVVAAVAFAAWALSGPDRTGQSPPTVADLAAAEEHLRVKAAEVHAIIGAPPVHQDLRLTGPLRCNAGDRAPSDPPRAGFGYLVTRPGSDPVGRMPEWAADLRARGWAVTYPVERRYTLDKRLLVATHDGFQITIDARYPPDLSIEVRGLC